jgi:hypothetical protein
VGEAGTSESYQHSLSGQVGRATTALARHLTAVPGAACSRIRASEPDDGVDGEQQRTRARPLQPRGADRDRRDGNDLARASSRPSSAPIWTSWLKFLDLSSLMFMRKLGLPVASMKPNRRVRRSRDDEGCEPLWHAPHEQPEPSWWGKRGHSNHSSRTFAVKWLSAR